MKNETKQAVIVIFQICALFAKKSTLNLSVFKIQYFIIYLLIMKYIIIIVIVCVHACVYIYMIKYFITYIYKWILYCLILWEVIYCSSVFVGKW